MALVAIKVGENYLGTNDKFSDVSKHFDIIDFIDKKSLGSKGNKHYFFLNVDTSGLSKSEFNSIRALVKQSWLVNTELIDIIGEPIYRTESKRIWFLDSSLISTIGLSKVTNDNITVMANLKREKQDYDMMTINRFDKVVPFSLFIKAIKNKQTDETLEYRLLHG